MTEKQIKAAKRNWNKFQLTGGFRLDLKALTPEERDTYYLIINLKNELLSYWDDNTEKHLETKLKPHKCQYCGKRSNVKYTLGQFTVCLKHFKELNNGNSK